MPMHPPPFSITQRLSDWPDCRLEFSCACKMVDMPVKMIIQRHGDRTFEQLRRTLRCAKCGKLAAPVYLCAGIRRFNYGGPPDWAVEVVPPPEPGETSATKSGTTG